ncbi:MAG: DNA-binding protein [Rhodospirillaceae bacterium]
MTTATLVTPETVAQAAEAIAASDQRPTVQRIRDHLGGGSPNAILSYLTTWKDAQRGSRAKAEQPQQPKPEPPPSDAPAQLASLHRVARAMDEMTSAIRSVEQAICADLSDIVTAERAAAAAQVQTLTTAAQQRAETDAAVHALAMKMVQETAAADLDDARAQSKELAEANTKHEDEAAQAAQTIADLRGRLAEAERLATTLTERLSHVERAVERASADAERAAAAAAQATVERESAQAAAIQAERGRIVAETRAGDAIAAAERDRIERDEARETAAGIAAERDSAISESHRLGSDLGVCRESLKASQDRAAEAETRAAASEGRAGEQQRQIESLTRQIETLQNKIAQSPVVATPVQAGTTTRKVGSPATKVN